MTAPQMYGAGTESPPQSDVAGRLEPAPHPLRETIDEWCENMRARRRKPKGIDACRQIVEAMVRECGIRDVAEFTSETMVGWLDSKASRWKGTTYNRNLALLRAFTRYLRRRKILDADPLELAERAFDDGNEGSRASTLDEARAIVREAWLRTQTDKRCKGNRALYWMMLFSHGCRVGEPEQLTWAHVFLDDPIPFIRWTKDIQKNRKDQAIPLTPELAALLRDHREKNFSGTNCKVFHIVPPRHTFRKDRDAVGIQAVDNRGRTYSPHSARKYFATALVTAGVHERVVDLLMRHQTSTPGRYQDHDLATMAQAVAKLSTLWPEARVGHGPEKVDPKYLTQVGTIDEHLGVTSGVIPTSLQPSGPNLPPPPGVTTKGEGRVGAPTAPIADTRAGSSSEARGLLSSFMGPEMPRGGPEMVDRTALADLLDALARLVRREVSDGGTGQGRAGERAG